MKIKSEVVAENFTQALNALNKIRLEALAQARDDQAMARSLLQHEVKRTVKKLGAQHPRVGQLQARLESNLQLIQALDVEHEIAQIQVPAVAEGGALLHGRVKDENGRGLNGLSVFVEDEKGETLRFLGCVETDASGYYALPVDAAAVARLAEGTPDGIFLAVSTRRGTPVYRETNPVKLSGGDRVVVEVELNRRDLSPVRGCSGPPSVPVQVLDVDGPARLKTKEEGTFTATVNEDEATEPLEYCWDFGDGATATSLTAKHAYDDAGTYTVAFTASNRGGTATKPLEVIVVIPAKIINVTSHPRTPRVGTRVQFTPTLEGALPFAYAWDFGDGATGTTANPRHPYMQAGTYTVTLKVSNEAGEDESTLTVEIKPKRTGRRRTKKDDP